MMHQDGLENRRSGNATVGSNPTLSANFCGISAEDGSAHGASFTPRSALSDGAKSGTPILASAGICKTCHGSGNIVTFGVTRPAEYWPCPACGGAGSRALFSPPIINWRRRPILPAPRARNGGQ